jgi:8-oxo-dGTP pyrophosphatase MutT (NUDIX family)
MQPQQPYDEEVYRGSLIRVLRRTLSAPSGGRAQYDIVEHPDSVAIAALRDDPAHPGNPLVALVQQERPAINQRTWELPAGLVNPNEVGQPEQTARRELREETGFDAATMRLLLRTYSSPGFTNEAVSLYVATRLEPVAGQSGPQDPSEIGGVSWVQLSDALARCGSGDITDSKTVLGLLLTREALASSNDSTGGNAVPYSPGMPYPIQPDAASPTDPLTNADQTLKLESMMLAEFNYASATAYQALDDRGRMFGIYLGIASVLAGGVGALYELGKKDANSEVIAAALLLLAGLIGVIFFFKIVRIRQAFSDSLITMNVIKEHYIARFRVTVPEVEKIFRWRMKSMPSAHKFGSLTFLVCAGIIGIDSLALGLAATVITELATHDSNPDFIHLPNNPLIYGIGIGVFALALVVQFVAYVLMLRGAGQKKALEQVAGDLNIPIPGVVR